jgi:hypothetical protein
MLWSADITPVTEGSGLAAALVAGSIRGSGYSRQIVPKCANLGSVVKDEAEIFVSPDGALMIPVIAAQPRTLKSSS